MITITLENEEKYECPFCNSKIEDLDRIIETRISYLDGAITNSWNKSNLRFTRILIQLKIARALEELSKTKEMKP